MDYLVYVYLLCVLHYICECCTIFFAELACARLNLVNNPHQRANATSPPVCCKTASTALTNMIPRFQNPHVLLHQTEHTTRQELGFLHSEDHGPDVSLATSSNVCNEDLAWLEGCIKSNLALDSKPANGGHEKVHDGQDNVRPRKRAKVAAGEHREDDGRTWPSECGTFSMCTETHTR